MEQWKIDRINELANKKKNGIALTEKEIIEQKSLREEYIAAFRRSVKAQLDNTVVLEKDGTKRPLKKHES